MHIFNSQLLNSFFIVFLFLLGSYAVTLALRLVERLTKKTGTDLDDKIIMALALPIRFLAAALGFFVGFRDYDWTWQVKDKEFTIADVFFVLVVLIVGFTLSRLLKTLFKWYGGREDLKLSQTMFIFVRKVVSVIVYLVAAMVIFRQLGIEIGPLLGAMGVAGLAIAFGLQSTMENLFSALFVVMDKSINVGDWIQLEDGTKAYIEDISWRSVRIRTIAGNTVIVPNSVFVGQKIASYDYPEKSFYTNVAVGVSYDTDLEKAEYVAGQAAAKVIQDVGVSQQENNPIVRFREFGDSSINMIVIVKVDNVGQEGNVQHALIKEIHKQFAASKIEIPFPQRVVEIKGRTGKGEV